VPERKHNTKTIWIKMFKEIKLKPFRYRHAGYKGREVIVPTHS
jgi:hypothetical protein